MWKMGAERISSSGDSWMYPYQRTPMGKPYGKALYKPYIVGIYG